MHGKDTREAEFLSPPFYYWIQLPQFTGTSLPLFGEAFKFVVSIHRTLGKSLVNYLHQCLLDLGLPRTYSLLILADEFALSTLEV